MTDTTDPRELVDSDCKFFETWADDIRAGGICSSDADKMDAMCSRYRSALDRADKAEAERDAVWNDAIEAAAKESNRVWHEVGENPDSYVIALKKGDTT